jgi:group I intron endonuclease
MKGYLYKTECLANGKLYIGISVNQKNKQNYLGSGVALKDAIKKYGKENFKKTILVDNVNSMGELNSLEKEYIKKYDCFCPVGYNIDLGGKGNGNHSESTKNKISKTKKGNYSKKQRIANIDSHKGLKLSSETKLKISLSMKGKPSWNKGKKMPKGHSEKMRKIMTGKKMDKKQIEILDKENSIKLVCDGVVDAANKIGVSIGSISRLCSGKVSHLKQRYYLVGALTLEAQPIASGVGG